MSKFNILNKNPLKNESRILSEDVLLEQEYTQNEENNNNEKEAVPEDLISAPSTDSANQVGCQFITNAWNLGFVSEGYNGADTLKIYNDGCNGDSWLLKSTAKIDGCVQITCDLISGVVKKWLKNKNVSKTTVNIGSLRHHNPYTKCQDINGIDGHETIHPQTNKQESNQADFAEFENAFIFAINSLRKGKYGFGLPGYVMGATNTTNNPYAVINVENIKNDVIKNAIKDANLNGIDATVVFFDKNGHIHIQRQ
jgi:hypothetical protein